MIRRSKRFTVKQVVALLEEADNNSLPSDDDNSEAEADDGAQEELRHMDNVQTSVADDTSSSSAGHGQAGNVADSSADCAPVVSDIESSDEDSACDEWNTSVNHFQNMHQMYQGSPEVLVSLTSTDTAGQYFDAVLDDEISDLIVTQTNLYRNQKQAAQGRSAAGEPFTDGDLRAWIGLVILMGIHQLPEVQNYWSSDPLLCVPAVKTVMPSKKFKKIVETIHCNDNTTNPPRGETGHDKLHKLRPLLTKLHQKFATLYKVSGTVSVDESMIAFKGRSSMKQYMPMKPVKRGYKVWCLADSATGFVTTFDIYTGKAENADDSYSLGERVVIDLCTRTALDEWTVVAFDNFFTSVKLTEELYKRKLFSVGTVRAQRKGLPEFMKKKSKLERGEFLYETKGCVAAVKWMDNREVTVLSTCHSPKEVRDVTRRAKDGTRSIIPCPLAIAEYNRIMGGVDRFDQFRERYSVGRRSVKWWHRILYWLIDLMVVNAYVMYQINRRQHSVSDQLSFRLQLVRHLTSSYTSSRKRGRPVSFLANKKSVPEEVRLAQVGNHFPQQNQNFRRCRFCSTTKAEKRPRYTCTACDVPLCLEPCFRKFHAK